MGSLCSAFANTQNTTGANTGTSSGTGFSNTSGTNASGTSGATSGSGTTASQGTNESLGAGSLTSSLGNLTDLQDHSRDAHIDTSGNLTAAGAGFGNAAATAGGLAATGIAPGMAAFSLPWQQQAAAAQALSNQGFAQGVQTIGSGQASRGALGNSNNAIAKQMALQSKQLTDDARNADLANKGAQFQLQGSTADAAARTAALGQQNNALSGQAGVGATETSVNAQNQHLPYDLATQTAQAISSNAGTLGNRTSNTGQTTNTGTNTSTTAGTNTSGTNTGFSGNTSGTNTGTTTTQPSTGSIVSGLVGTGLTAWSDERVKENIKPIGKLDDGQIVYKYNLHGSPQTQIGLLAQEVEYKHPHAVGSAFGIKTVDYDAATKDAEKHSHLASGGIAGGAQSDFASKVRHAFSHFHAMRKEAQGGAVKGFEDGGVTPFASVGSPAMAAFGQSPLPTSDDTGLPWATTVAPHNGGPDPSNDVYWDKVRDAAVANPTGAQGPTATQKMARGLGSGLMDFSKSMAPQAPAGGSTQARDAGLESLNKSIAAMMAGRPQGGSNPILGIGAADGGPIERHGFADGGFEGNTPEFASAPDDAPLSYVGSDKSYAERGTPYSAPRAESGSWLDSIGSTLNAIPKPLSHGVWKGEEASPMQRFGMALMQVGNGPFAPMGKSVQEMSQEYLRKQEAERAAAALMGEFRGRPTLAAQEAVGAINGNKTLAKLAQEQAAQIATGRVSIDGKSTPTLQSQEFTEAQRVHDKPTWGIVGTDQYGNPKYGLIDVTKAMPARGSAPQQAVSQGAVPSASPAAAVTPENPSGLPAGVIAESPVTPNRGAPELTGEEFLRTLDPADRIKVKHIAEGLEPFPSGMSAGKGRGAFLAQAVTQYDPSFDVRNYQMRQKTLNSFKAGPIAEQVKALNTVPGHLEDLYKATEKLGNFTYLPGAANPIYNAVRGQVSPEYQKAHAQFDASAAAVAAEMAKVFRASGMSRADFEDWKQLLYSNASPSAIKGAIEKAVQLIDSRTDALKYQWSEGMGPSIPFTAISPKAKEVFDKLRGDKPTDWGNTSEGIKLSKPIADMALDELNKLPPAQLSDAQLQEARMRRKALMGGQQ